MRPGPRRIARREELRKSRARVSATSWPSPSPRPWRVHGSTPSPMSPPPSASPAPSAWRRRDDPAPGPGWSARPRSGRHRVHADGAVAAISNPGTGSGRGIRRLRCGAAASRPGRHPVPAAVILTHLDGAGDHPDRRCLPAGRCRGAMRRRAAELRGRHGGAGGQASRGRGGRRRGAPHMGAVLQDHFWPAVRARHPITMNSRDGRHHDRVAAALVHAGRQRVDGSTTSAWTAATPWRPGGSSLSRLPVDDHGSPTADVQVSRRNGSPRDRPVQDRSSGCSPRTTGSTIDGQWLRRLPRAGRGRTGRAGHGARHPR